MEPRTVLHVIPASPFGGAQRLAIDLAQAQSKAGLDTKIWYTNAGTEARDAANEANIAVVSPIGGGVWTRMRALNSALQRETADIVHLHLPPPWIVGVLSRQRKYGLMTHLHLQPTPKIHSCQFSRLIGAMQIRDILSRSDLVISISQWIEDEWRFACPKLKTPSRVIYNGISIPSDAAFRGRHEDPVIGMATRLSAGKGVEEFIDLAARIHELAPHIQFRLAGDGSMRAEYERLALERGLGGILSFCGFVSHIPTFWQGLDIAVFSAPIEPFGLRLIEPIAHGVPVIAYRNGTGSDEVIDRCRGIVPTEYGQVGEFARLAVALTQSQRKRKQLVEAGIADLRRSFSIEKMEASVRTAYREACNPSFRHRSVAQLG